MILSYIKFFFKSSVGFLVHLLNMVWEVFHVNWSARCQVTFPIWSCIINHDKYNSDTMFVNFQPESVFILIVSISTRGKSALSWSVLESAVCLEHASLCRLFALILIPMQVSSDIMNYVYSTWWMYFIMIMYLTVMHKQRKNNAAMMNIITTPPAPIMK